MGISLFHLLPEAGESIGNYYKNYPDSVWGKLPLNYLIAFLSYSLILLLEKVAFDSHSLTEGEHHHHQHDDNEKLEPFINKTGRSCSGEEEYQNLKHTEQNKYELNNIQMPRGRSFNTDTHENVKLTPLTNNIIIDEQPKENDNLDTIDIDEETLKNIVSTKGKFASYLQNRNILFTPKNAIVDPTLHKAAKILHKTRQCNSEEEKCMTNFIKNTIERKESVIPIEEDENTHFHPASNITPYILLIALSIHGLFEGIALGLQKLFHGVIFLAIAIISHKWAEAFTLGISFSRTGTEKGTFIKMIILFCLFTPLGVFIGMLIETINEFITGIFLALSGGTFLYVSASEVIVEEFSISRHKFQKYFLYLLGGILIAGLCLLEVE
jgi:zinc transporter ZupT